MTPTVPRIRPVASRAPLALLALAPLWLAGCAGLAQPPAAVAPAVPPAWQAPPPAAATPAGEASAAFARFDDPAWPALAAAAEAASATLSQARSRIAQAQAARTAAGAALAPQASAGVQAVRGRTDLRQPTGSQQTATLSAAWEIDLFGGNAAARDAAEARLVAARADALARRIAVVAETASTLAEFRACEAQLALASADAASRTESARLTDVAANAGFRAPADAALARAGAAQGRSQEAAQRAACEQLTKALVALTAIDEPTLRRQLAAGAGRLPAVAAVAPPAVPAELLARRPDIVALSQGVAAAAADVGAREADRLPRVSLSGSVGAVRLAGAGESASGTTWTLGPLAVSLPVFDAGRRAADVAAARAAYDDAVVQLQAGVRQAVREVEDALVQLDATARRGDDARRAAEDFETALRATEARWRGGLASAFELEDARRSALAARTALVDLDRQRVVAWIALARSLGGGTP